MCENNMMKDVKILGQSIACIASLFPAWDPPLMTLNAGTGKTNCLLPARLAMCCSEEYLMLENRIAKSKHMKNDQRGLICSIPGTVESS